MTLVTHRSILLALLSGLAAKPASGAFGDEIARRTLPAPCTTNARGLGFDGRTLFYSIRNDPDVARIRKLDAATGADLGSIEPRIGAQPVVFCCSGNEYDPSRERLWVTAGSWIHSVDPGTGQVRDSMDRLTPDAGLGLAYDPWRDVVLEAPHDYQVQGYCPPLYAVNHCEFYNVPVSVHGMTFDGYDAWHYSPEKLPAPAPQNFGVVFPTDSLGNPDFNRVIDVPGSTYQDLAFDCMTFPVPVVWIAHTQVCELIAYEIAMRGPCLDMASEHVVRAALYAPLDPLARPTVLPLVNATAQAFWAAPRPFLFADDRFGILGDLSQPLSFYRLLGPADAERGNVLRAVKDASRDAVVLSKP